MGYHYIISPSLENAGHFNGFRCGQTSGLTYIYSHLSSTLYHYGLRIVHDEFVVNTILQEAFLKLWAFRERMTSMEHITRFLKLTMRWECMAYYRNRMETLYRKALRLDWTDTFDLADALTPEEDTLQSTTLLHLVRSMIPRLNSDRQRTIVSLYAKDGLTIKQIATRLHISTQATTHELHEGLTYLRAVFADGKSKNHDKPNVIPAIHGYSGLSNEQSHIVTMRRQMKYSFSQIADLLKLSQPYVQKQYVEACSMVKPNRQRL